MTRLCPLATSADGTGDCGGEGCCCTCALEVIKGAETLNEQKAQERQMLRKKPRWRLACRARIDPTLEEDSELVLKVSPRAWVEEIESECLVAEEE
jgi:ferredoxin